jgi:hypothetical protein
MSEVIDAQVTEVNNSQYDNEILKFEFKVSDVNNILNILNKPLLTDAVTLVTYINLIQNQCIPQMQAITGANQNGSSETA